MKLKSLLFALLITIQNIVMAAPANSLREVYDDYLYSMTIEWDQADEAKLAQIREKLNADLLELEAQGALTKNAIKNLIEGEVNEGRVPEEVLNSLISATGEIDLGKLQVAMQVYDSGLHAQGANWNGRALFKIVAWSFFPALIAITVITQTGRKEMCSLPTNYPYGQEFPCN